MITIITGKPGSGKTTFLADSMLRALKNGEEVWANFAVADKRVHYSEDIFELLSGTNRVVFMDEIQVFMNSRDWANLPLSIQFRLQQHRHYGIDIVGATQHIKRLDTVARELVHHYYEIRKVLGTREPGPKKKIKNPWALYVIRQYEPEDATIKRRNLAGFDFLFATKSLYSFFDTHDKKPEPLSQDYTTVRAYICPTCHHRKIIS